MVLQLSSVLFVVCLGVRMGWVGVTKLSKTWT